MNISTPLTNELSQAVSKKLSSPVVLTFIAALIFYNWESLAYFILNDSPVYDRITFIKENFSSVNTTITQPLAATFLIVFGVPFITASVKIFDIQLEAVTERLKARLNETVPLNPDTHKNIRRLLREERGKQITLIEESEQDINEYKNLAKKWELRVKELVAHLDRFKLHGFSSLFKLNAKQRQILNLFLAPNMEDGEISHSDVSELSSVMGEDIATIKSEAAPLVMQGLLKFTEVNSGMDYYSLTDIGRAYIESNSYFAQKFEAE